MKNFMYLFFLLGITVTFFAGCSDTTEPVRTVAAPVFSITDSTYTVPQSVTITTETSGAEIRYTTDGSEPEESSTLYTKPLIISTDTVLKARAYKNNWEPSEVSVLTVFIDIEIHRIEFIDLPDTIGLNTDLTLTVALFDAGDNPVPDNMLVTFSATHGTFVDNDSVLTEDGYASVVWNSGAAAGTAVITAIAGDVSTNSEIVTLPGLPASITLTPQYKDNGQWLPLPPEGIPVNFEHHVRILTIVEDEYGNPVPGIALEYETDLAVIQPFAETDSNGEAHPFFFPGTTAGTAHISVSTVLAGEDGEPVLGSTMITIYTEDVNSIIFTTQEEIYLDVIGVGGITSRQLRIELLDVFGNLVPEEYWVTYEILDANPPAGVNINNEGLSTDVLAQNGIAVTSINSGTGAGSVKVKVSLVVNPGINATKSNIIIRPGPVHNVLITAGSYNEGESMGGGIWRIEVGAFIRDIHDNPPVDGTPVHFSLGDDPQPPADTYFDPAVAYSVCGYAGTYLYYHGRNTYDEVNIMVVIDIFTIEKLISLPIQQPRLDLVASGYFDFFNDDPPDAYSQVTIIANVHDGQNNPVSNGSIKLTATNGQFFYYEWLDDQGVPINDPETPEIIRTYEGTAKGYLRIYIWEIPPPIDEYFTSIDVQLTAFLMGTNVFAQTSFTIRRYSINFP